MKRQPLGQHQRARAGFLPDVVRVVSEDGEEVVGRDVEVRRGVFPRER